MEKFGINNEYESKLNIARSQRKEWDRIQELALEGLLVKKVSENLKDSPKAYDLFMSRLYKANSLLELVKLARQYKMFDPGELEKESVRLFYRE
jgi:hypothetical protein